MADLTGLAHLRRGDIRQRDDAGLADQAALDVVAILAVDVRLGCGEGSVGELDDGQLRFAQGLPVRLSVFIRANFISTLVMSPSNM